MKSNIVLIGMPGCGKSTLGVLLAKELQKAFVDTDIIIQQGIGKSLQDILHEAGFMALRQMEAHLIESTYFENSVVATGGSAVYGENAMLHLKRDGIILYLRAPLEVIAGRIHNEDSRGIARPADHSLAEVYAERCPLYEQYADATIDVSGGDTGAILQKLVDQLS